MAKRANELSEEGKIAARRGDWALAEAKLEQAFELSPSYQVANNLGLTEYERQKNAEAAEHLAFALRTWPNAENQPQREVTARRLAELKQVVATVKVIVSAPDAAVFLDGKPVGRSPLADDLYVMPGAHTLEAKLDGDMSAKENVQLGKGTARTINLALRASPSAGEPRLGAVDSMGSAGSGEGQLIGVDGAKPAAQGGLHKPLVISGVALSATFIGMGAVFSGVSTARGSDADAQQAALLRDSGKSACQEPTTLTARCREQEESLVARDTFRTLALASFVMGGALGAATTIYVVTAPRSKTRASVRVLPTPVAHGGALLITGSF